MVVTRDTSSDNQSITIEAKLASVSSTADYAYLKLFQKFLVIPNQLYTICGKCTYKSDNILIVYPNTSGTTTTYLSTENVYIVSLAHAASEYSFGFLARVPLTTEIGTTIKFTIKNPALYKGAYVNPPYFLDLTSVYTSRFLLSTDFYAFENNLKSSSVNKKGWIDIYRLPVRNFATPSSSSLYNFHGKIRMSHTYNNGFPEVYDVEFAYVKRVDGAEPHAVNSGYLLVPKVYRQVKDSLRITKFRLSTDGTYVYLQGYHNFTTSNTWYSSIEDFFNFDTDKESLARNLISKDPSTHDTAQIQAKMIVDGLVMTNTAHNDYTLIGSEVTPIEAYTSIPEYIPS